MGRKILVPVDLTDHSVKVLSNARSIALEGDELVLLHVVPDPSHLAGFHIPHQSTDQTRDELIQDASKAMDRFIERYAPGTMYIIEFGLPSKEILRVAEREQVEALVIGSHQGGGKLEHLFSSSTTKKVLRRAKCSVEIVPLPLENEEELQNKPKM